jgi:type II secretory pathway pseudopilin PulG
MVEMICVLAIAGVIATTVVWGFRYGMNKTKANRLYNDFIKK